MNPPKAGMVVKAVELENLIRARICGAIEEILEMKKDDPFSVDKMAVVGAALVGSFVAFMQAMGVHKAFALTMLETGWDKADDLRKGLEKGSPE